jgi:hypothetical protein
MTSSMVHVTSCMVHVTNLTPVSECNPGRAYGRRHQSMTASMVHVTASMVHVTNPVTPGSECQPCLEFVHVPRVGRVLVSGGWDGQVNYTNHLTNHPKYPPETPIVSPKLPKSPHKPPKIPPKQPKVSPKLPKTPL